jgi:large subunit ribosomal protein L30
MAIKLKITQHKSGVGRSDQQKRTLAGLGLRGPHKVVVLQDTPEIRGMIRKVSHLVSVESADE